MAPQFRTRRYLTVDGMPALAFLLTATLSAVVIANDHATSPAPWLVALVGVIFAGALVIRRLSPSAALSVAWVAALVQMGLQLDPSLVDAAIYVVIYSAAAYGRRPVSWAALASAPLGGLLAAAYLTLRPAGDDGNRDWEPAAVVLVVTALTLAVAWLVGTLVRTARRSDENQRRAAEAAEQAVAEQQRLQIARDMHDVVAHSLAVVVAQADGARYAAAAKPEVATDALSTIATTARSALADVRILLRQLRLGEPAGPQPTTDDLLPLFDQVRAADVDLRVTERGTPVRAAAGTQLAVYRIAQEALTNALRHGDGSGIDLEIDWSPAQLILRVQNRVRPEGSEPGSGQGLVGMRERAELVGGTLETHADAGTFTVLAQLPIEGIA